ncbi:MAG: sigma-70 family RNA polymerase sigma factor [Sphingobium sp.]
MNARVARREIGALYESHVEWLRDWLRQHTRCSHRAADLAQDTFCRLLERPQFVVPNAPRSYLATVARRLLIDDIRRRDVEQAVIDASALRQSVVDDISPERIAEATQLLHAVVHLLDALPEETRTAFLLRRIEGLEQKDIAAHLGISLSTVKRHIALAYARCYAIAYAD